MLHTLTITEAHTKLKSKEISATELTQSCIDRINAVDDNLNAVVHPHFENALAHAKQIDTEGTFEHPLTGIPMLVKDVYCEAGVPTTACSNMLRDKDYVPPHNATTIDRLNNVGAISLGKANTDEFTCGASCETSCFGPCRNPWDTTRVAGGSSGGSAAGVGADECIFALGTDTGGSIRQPAGYCNCTGLRCTYGRNSRYGVISMASSLDTIGPICKSVEDTALVLQAIAGHDPFDATTGRVEVPDYSAALTGDIQGMKIGIPQEYFVDGLNPEVEKSVRSAAGELERLGATLHEISLPHTKYAVATYYILCPSEVSSNMARYDGIRYGHGGDRGSGTGDRSGSNEHSELVEYYFRNRSKGFGDEVKRRIMIGTYALSAGYFDAYYRQAQKVRTLIKQDFESAFEQVDLILSPVSPSTAFEIGAHQNDPVAMYLEDIFLSSQALAGIPALSVPCGFSSENLPIGLQLMGPQWGEPTVLQAGHAYQQATDWHTRKPDCHLF